MIAKRIFQTIKTQTLVRKAIYNCFKLPISKITTCKQLQVLPRTNIIKFAWRWRLSLMHGHTICTYQAPWRRKYFKTNR